MRRRLAAVLAAVAVLAPAGAAAQAPGPRGLGVVSGVWGSATLSRPARSAAAVRLRDDVFARDRIATAEHALVKLLLGGEAVVTVRELSRVELVEDGARAVADLTAGRIGLSVASRNPAGPRPLAVRSPNAIAAVRGTVVVADVIRLTGPPRVQTIFYVRTGRIEVVARARPGMTPVAVSAGEFITIIEAAVGPVRQIPAARAAALMAGLAPGTPQHTDPPDAAREVAVEHGRAGLGSATVGGVPRTDTTFPDRAYTVPPPLPPPRGSPSGSSP
jgi:hypothetical protein